LSHSVTVQLQEIEIKKKKKKIKKKKKKLWRENFQISKRKIKNGTKLKYNTFLAKNLPNILIYIREKSNF